MRRAAITGGLSVPALVVIAALGGPAWAQAPATPAPRVAPGGLACVPLPPPESATVIETPETKPCPLTEPMAEGDPCTCGPIVGKVAVVQPPEAAE